MTKGDDTKKAILRSALDLASEVGLEGLTVGILAKRVGMSKSGLYAHFKSKEDLQVQVLNAAAELFTELVFQKAIKLPRGLPRVQALFDLWVNWSAQNLSGGCPFIAAAVEYDDRSGPVRDIVVEHLAQFTRVIAKAAQICVDEGHFRKNLDADQFAYEFWAIMLAYHHFHRLMRSENAHQRARQAFANLIASSIK